MIPHCHNFRAGSKFTRDQCRLCWLRHHVAKYAVRAGTATRAKLPARPPAAPCRFRGPDLTGEERQALYDAGQTHVTHNRRFALCLRPGFAFEGRAVCGCGGKGVPKCGKTCLGYEAGEGKLTSSLPVGNGAG